MTLTKTVLRDVNGRMTIVPNSMMVTNQVVNYTKSGFVEIVLPFPVTLETSQERVGKIIMRVLQELPMVLPNVQGEELMVTERELNIPRLRCFLSDRTKMAEFVPCVLVQEATAMRIILGFRFWIWEVQHRDVIVSEVLSTILDRMRWEGMTVP